MRAPSLVYQSGGNNYGYSQWHDQEDDRIGRTAHFQDGQRSDHGFGKGDRSEKRAYGLDQYGTIIGYT